jgi:tripartite-type tricarboxylate transporter receptor subunit TctC
MRGVEMKLQALLRWFVLMPAQMVILSLGTQLAFAEQFFSGKTITISTFTAPGGAYDAYIRLLARHMGKHIPGRPNLIATNQPGAGGILNLNHAGKVAPQDGTYLTLVGVGLLTQEVIGATRLQVSLRSFKWIGNVNKDNNVVATWPTSQAKTIADARKQDVALGSLGAGSIDAQLPSAYNAMLGSRFKVIFGYSGTPQVMLAMERGEVEGKENTWASFKTTLGMKRAAALNVLIQNATSPDPELANVPLLIDLVKGDPKKEAIARLLSVTLELSKPLAAPPGVPDDRIQILRRAFMATARDPEFLADAQNAGFPIEAMPGADLQLAVEQILTAPRDVVEATRAALVSGSR